MEPDSVYLTARAGNPPMEGGTELTPLEVLELVRDLASQEWQGADGKRYGATDNAGNRLWFISEPLMADVRAALARAPRRDAADTEPHGPNDMTPESAPGESADPQSLGDTQ